MKRLVKQVGPCTWTPAADDPFTMLVRCVIYQQISTKAARSIYEKLLAGSGGAPVCRKRLLTMTEAEFRACGVSGPKQRAIRAIAEHVAANPDLLPGIDTRDEPTLRKQLVAIKGIGPWSVDMFLMFGLARPDVLPVGDYGLRTGVKKAFDLADLPTAAELEEIAAPWKPYRSVATWYFWRSLGPVPQSGEGG
jgi:DNA-3-methyladenine glycosylase II